MFQDSVFSGNVKFAWRFFSNHKNSSSYSFNFFFSPIVKLN
ncbi:hypothetical protein FD23_GL001781 [Lactobacillus delbrueckii subsp. delbrueckii DSM 20074 = JCM 1012]|nr:hypothetical protein FD23_GL001781 [Lactobacillus delbrueckii subsp. delbrueckii DSM 20074 = JCM 1012]